MSKEAGMSILKGLGVLGLEILKEVNKQTAEQRRKEQLKKEEEERMEKEAEIYAKKIAKAMQNVTYGYDREVLEEMSVEELRKELYSIWKENTSIFNSKGQKARELWNETAYSEERYRAKCIKFLLENGDI